jgi:hypothetical protein
MSFVWILVIGIAGMAGTLALVNGWERRRARLLKEAGMSLGFRALQKGEQLALPSVEIMRKRGRTIGAALEGEWQGQRVMIFDLSYPAGKSVSQTTVLVLRLPQPRLPEFAAIRKNIWLYTPTVDLPRVTNPPQSLKSHWLMYAPQGEWPLDDAAAEWLARNGAWSYEGHGSGLFVYTRSKRAPTRALRAWLDEAIAAAQELAHRIPAASADSASDDPAQPSNRAHVLQFKVSLKF